MYFTYHPCLQGTQHASKHDFKEKIEVAKEVLVLVEDGDDGNHHQGSISQTIPQIVFISLFFDVIYDDRN